MGQKTQAEVGGGGGHAVTLLQDLQCWECSTTSDDPQECGLKIMWVLPGAT